MAGREKKPALIKKQNISATLSKDIDNQLDVSAEKTTPVKTGAAKLEATTTQSSAGPAPATKNIKPTALRGRKPNPTTKALKKNIKLKFKAKAKKGKKLKLSKSLFKSKKVLDTKNVTIVKNGIKKRGRQPKATKTNTKTDKKEDDKDLPPVLEPMTTISTPTKLKTPKKEPKKRTKKQITEDSTETIIPIIDTKKIKIEPVDNETVEDVLNDVANELQLDLDLLLKKPTKKIRVTKKPIKPAVKQKKPTTPKKQQQTKEKVEPKEKKIEIKNKNKEKIIETLSKDFNMDSDAQNVINKLDLNVSKTMKKNIKKRRHSIEKFNSLNDNHDTSFEQPFSLFSNIRGNASPKTKRNARIRQSIDNVVTKRFSPYSTRSDSPARILRNGKHRKLKGNQLLEGLESEYKRRRRINSEVSTNDVSKFSDYLSESDSNFSDMTNITENGNCDDSSLKEEGIMTKSDLLRKEILDSITSPSPDELQNLNIKQISTKFTAILKRSLSTETSQITQENINEDVKTKEEINIAFTDTNSNDLKPDIKTEIDNLPTTPTKKEKTEILEPLKVEKIDPDDKDIEKITPSPSYKVPEKLFILDQMKQTFNDGSESPDNTTTEQVGQKRTTRSTVKRTLKLSTSEENINENETKIIDDPEESKIEDTKIIEEPKEICTITDVNVDLNKNEFDTEKIVVVDAQIEESIEESLVPVEVESEDKSPDITLQVEEDITEEKSNIIENNVEDENINIESDKMEINEENPVESNPSEEIPMEEFEESTISKEEALKTVNDIHEDILNKLRGNSSLSISIKETTTGFKSKSGSESGESLNGIVMENMVNEAIKKLDEDKSEDASMDSVSTEQKEKVKETEVETNSEKSVDILDAINNIPKEQEIVETPENLAIKENILNALGLRSLKAAEEAKLREKQKPVNKNDVYTGTLKTVIKLNRSLDKKKTKERNPLKMTLQKSKGRSSKDGDCDSMKFDGASGKYDGENACYKVMKETSSSSTSRHSSDTVGANRKTHYSNRSNLEGEQTSDNDGTTAEGEPIAKELVIPEKASSFSIHPGRLCSDECAYCFGKFGLFDTPLHIAQIKSVERQSKILENEVYLTKDSCLCDACYRHVDRRSTGNCPTKNLKRNSNSAPHVPRSNYCHVINCDRESSNVLRRKWLLKMRKSITKLLNIDLDNPSLHSIPVCSEHYLAVEHLMVCALCKRRLTRNHIHYLASECEMLNAALQKEGIPVTLADKPLVCKLCRYFSSLLLKPPAQDSQSNTAEFFRQYKKRLLQCYDIEVADDEEQTEQSLTQKEKNEKDPLKKKKSNKSSKKSPTTESTPQESSEKTDQPRVPCSSENGESQDSSPSETVIDYETLVPNLSLECSDIDDKQEVPTKQLFRKLQIPESVREAVEISKIMKYKKSNLIERLGTNPSISVRQLFQGEEDLPLYANIDFNTPKERTPEGWDKSTCTIQYDSDTKQLWQELQRPYGNQSSFLRHLILLEKYFRNGDLTLAPSASHHAVNYSVSVQNRLRAYDNIPSSSVPMQPLTMLPFNQVKKSQSGIITTRENSSLSSVMNAANLPKNTPIPISQLNQNLLSQLSVRQKTQSVPPGLISIQGSTKPKQQKIKVPVNKNWKPTLIPVTSASTAADRRVSGLVQVISGGKPYHISLQDYNKMCYLKKSQEMRKMNEMKKIETHPPQLPGAILKPIVPRKQKTIPLVPKQVKDTPATITSMDVIKDSNGTQVENKNISPSKSIMILPKIPKSLTVIPQTVSRKLVRPQSPTLSIITKPSTSRS